MPSDFRKSLGLDKKKLADKLKAKVPPKPPAPGNPLLTAEILSQSSSGEQNQPRTQESPQTRVMQDKAPQPQVLYLCGHKGDNRYCQKCNAAKNIRQKERKAKTNPPPPPKPTYRKFERLPDGAVYHTLYHDDVHRWEGTLTVLVVDAVETFNADASAVFKLLAKLDRMFWDAWNEKIGNDPQPEGPSRPPL